MSVAFATFQVLRSHQCLARGYRIWQGRREHAHRRSVLWDRAPLGGSSQSPSGDHPGDKISCLEPGQEQPPHPLLPSESGRAEAPLAVLCANLGLEGHPTG